MSRTLQLKTRLAIAGFLLIATTVVTGVWSVTSFRRVSRVVGETVTANERLTESTAMLAGTLEREDDAMLLVLSDPAKGRAELVRQRAEVGGALDKVLGELDEQNVEVRLSADVDAYQDAIDELVVSGAAADARARYHDVVNPLLRRAVATTNEIREQHFRSSQLVAEWAATQASQSMQIVAMISIGALMLLVLIGVHFVRVVMIPLSDTTRAVEAIRRGDFTARVGTRRDDELGRLAGGLNRMADELTEFRRTNIGEVIAAKETLEATLEALPDAVLVIDGERKVSSANPRAADALGHTRERALDELPLPEITRTAVDGVLATSVATDARVDLTKAIELAVDGRPRRLLPRIVPIPGRRGAVLVLSDVTELAQLDEMRLELVAVASHELRTPLTTMRMTLSMLQERANSYTPHDREVVATAMVGIDQLSGLVDEFLDLTRIEAGQLRLQWTRVSLRDLIERAAKAIAPACDEARVTLEVEYVDVPASIAGDHARLAMVISNLLTNAVKYTPAGGRVVIHASAAQGRASITVDDTGSGVPAEYRERVFDRFFRVEHVTESGRRSAGAGIGLYIARQVIAAHGGTIHCEASPLGGARFVATVPVEAESQISTPVSNSLTTVK